MSERQSQERSMKEEHESKSKEKLTFVEMK
jgi:hypothetical protein